jgi:hypothetical protein
MKRIALGLLVFSSVATWAQTKNTPLEKLQKVYREQVAWEAPGELSYDDNTKLITVKTFLIPLSQDTKVSFDKKKGNKVIFTLQKNTAITQTTDSNYKRAYFELEFKTKDACMQFITYFNQLKKEL